MNTRSVNWIMLRMNIVLFFCRWHQLSFLQVAQIISKSDERKFSPQGAQQGGRTHPWTLLEEKLQIKKKNFLPLDRVVRHVEGADLCTFGQGGQLLHLEKRDQQIF